MPAVKQMPKFKVTVTNKDGSRHITEGWGVIRKTDAEQIIKSELGVDRACSVQVSTGKKVWVKTKKTVDF